MREPKRSGINGRILVDIGAYALTIDDFERIFGVEPERITDAVNKAVVLRTDNTEFPFNVQIWTSIKGGPFLYCGNGKFCRTEAEIRQTVLKYRALSVEHADERHIGNQQEERQ